MDEYRTQRDRAIARAQWQQANSLLDNAIALRDNNTIPKLTCLGDQGECAFNGACMYQCEPALSGGSETGRVPKE